MTAIIQDERYNVAEEAISDAFFLLLKEKSMDKITVSDVIKKAGIVRSTFYNHYENVPDMIDKIADRTIKEIFEMMEDFHPKNDQEVCKSYYLSVCNYTKTNSFLAELLRSPKGDKFFEKMMMMFHKYVKDVMKNKSAGIYNKEKMSYIVAGSIGSALGVLHKWTSENFDMSAEEVADILTETFMAGMLPFIS